MEPVSNRAKTVWRRGELQRTRNWSIHNITLIGQRNYYWEIMTGQSLEIKKGR